MAAALIGLELEPYGQMHLWTAGLDTRLPSYMLVKAFYFVQELFY